MTINKHNSKHHWLSKKQIISIGTAVLFTFGSTTFIGCGNEEAHNHGTETQEEHAQHAEYQCPMDCEKGKIYDEPGICPVCKMDLTKIKDE